MTKAPTIWIDYIMTLVETNPESQFWRGTLQLDIEVEICKSIGLFRNSKVTFANVSGYKSITLGEILIEYLKTSFNKE